MGTRAPGFKGEGDSTVRSQAAPVSPDSHCFSQCTFTELLLLIHQPPPGAGHRALAATSVPGALASSPQRLEDLSWFCLPRTLLWLVLSTHPPLSSQELDSLSGHDGLIAQFTPRFKGALRPKSSESEYHIL